MKTLGMMMYESFFQQKNDLQLNESVFLETPNLKTITSTVKTFPAKYAKFYQEFIKKTFTSEFNDFFDNDDAKTVNNIYSFTRDAVNSKVKTPYLKNELENLMKIFDIYYEKRYRYVKIYNIILENSQALNTVYKLLTTKYKVLNKQISYSGIEFKNLYKNKFKIYFIVEGNVDNSLMNEFSAEAKNILKLPKDSFYGNTLSFEN